MAYSTGERLFYFSFFFINFIFESRSSLILRWGTCGFPSSSSQSALLSYLSGALMVQRVVGRTGCGLLRSGFFKGSCRRLKSSGAANMPVFSLIRETSCAAAGKQKKCSQLQQTKLKQAQLSASHKRSLLPEIYQS